MALTGGGHAPMLSGHTWATPPLRAVASDQALVARSSPSFRPMTALTNHVSCVTVVIDVSLWIQCISFKYHPFLQVFSIRVMLKYCFLHKKDNQLLSCLHYYCTGIIFNSLLTVIVWCLFRWNIAPGVLWLFCFTCCLVMVIMVIFSRSIFISCLNNHQILFFKWVILCYY